LAAPPLQPAASEIPTATNAFSLAARGISVSFPSLGRFRPSFPWTKSGPGTLQVAEKTLTRDPRTVGRHERHQKGSPE
jgi:hypothetical protein